jgi:hypothetical protein
MEWMSDPARWRSRRLSERLDMLRIHYCTGPGAASQVVLAGRGELNRALNDAIDCVVAAEEQAFCPVCRAASAGDCTCPASPPSPQSPARPGE